MYQLPRLIFFIVSFLPLTISKESIVIYFPSHPEFHQNPRFISNPTNEIQQQKRSTIYPQSGIVILSKPNEQKFSKTITKLQTNLTTTEKLDGTTVSSTTQKSNGTDVSSTTTQKPNGTVVIGEMPHPNIIRIFDRKFPSTTTIQPVVDDEQQSTSMDVVKVTRSMSRNVILSSSPSTKKPRQPSLLRLVTLSGVEVRKKNDNGADLNSRETLRSGEIIVSTFENSNTDFDPWDHME